MPAKKRPAAAVATGAGNVRKAAKANAKPKAEAQAEAATKKAAAISPALAKRRAADAEASGKSAKQAPAAASAAASVASSVAEDVIASRSDPTLSLGSLALDVVERPIDCHFHVFGELDAYPPAKKRGYTPSPASFQDWQGAVGAYGFKRVVFVQPSCYGSDNSCMLDTMATCPLPCRGVAVIDSRTTDDELQRMKAAGVRAVRLNMRSTATSTTLSDLLVITADRIGRLGWHIEVFATLQEIASAASAISCCRVPVVIDHIGLAVAKLGPQQPGFDVLVRLVRDSLCWVKLSAVYRIANDEPAFLSATEIINSLISANSARLVWGSDWPHLGSHKESWVTKTSARDLLLPKRHWHGTSSGKADAAHPGRQCEETVWIH
eukprot:TRINITY_DN55275_c0_g1_i2.p1 TRINITY_DN55275_c0_g1~~TRINITY_DN55275_c0_g1_i2.p1  ORF type:complete len:379 (-),score=71.94 TRINITY_DN55275_c0_g1_i2:105-1241(-)